MRDEHGRYRSAKAIEDSSPSWALGCSKCTLGIVSAPELTGACELYLERLVQMLDVTVEFCECKAGVRYRRFLERRYDFLMQEARKHPLMQQHARNNSHLDIQIARNAMSNSYGYVKAPASERVPTIHFETV